jgi:hypothetical protein
MGRIKRLQKINEIMASRYLPHLYPHETGQVSPEEMTTTTIRSAGIG